VKLIIYRLVGRAFFIYIKVIDGYIYAKEGRENIRL